MRGRERVFWSTIGWIARALGHFTTALLGWILDWIAFKIGRVWATLIACLIVRNGRFVPLLGLLFDWVLSPQDTTFVFTLTILIVFIAKPFVFPDLEDPSNSMEQWRSYSKSSAITTPLFVGFVYYLHYPQVTKDWVRRATSSLMTDPPGIWQALTWLWILALCLSIPHQLHVRVVSSVSVRKAVKLTWQCIGRAFYEWKHPDVKIEADTLFELNQPFEHIPLTAQYEFRLLQILPQGNSRKLQCRVYHSALTDSPDYEAMSYTWGNPEKSKVIFIDGRPFKTTDNVYLMLRDRAPIWEPRTVWIDAICINQEDNEEKASQVSIMRYIYMNARKTTIWLGDYPNARLAADLIVELYDYIDTYQPTDQQLFDKYRSQRRSPRWLALGDLGEHPYFSRIWVVQECAASNVLHVAYGGELFMWKTLSTVLLRLFISFEFSTMIEDTAVVNVQRPQGSAHSLSNALVLSRVRDHYQGQNSNSIGSTLRDLLAQCWSFKSTDPRDRVFALLGLADDSNEGQLTPDYNKSVNEVFTETARFLFSKEHVLSKLLYCCGIGWLRDQPDLPSWAPDWSTCGRMVIGAFPAHQQHYRTSGDIEDHNIYTPIVDNRLQLDVIIVSRVTHLGTELLRPDPKSEEDPKLLDRLENWYLEARALAQKYCSQQRPTIESLEEAFWRTLCCDAPSVGAEQPQHGMKWPAPEIYAVYYRYFVKYFIEMDEDDSTLLFQTPETVQNLHFGGRYLTSIQNRCYSRCFGVTESGHMGLFAALSHVGDLVAIVPGTVTPYLFRATEDSTSEGPKNYRLVGECYVHGMVNGEKADASALETIYVV